MRSVDAVLFAGSDVVVCKEADQKRGGSEEIDPACRRGRCTAELKRKSRPNRKSLDSCSSSSKASVGSETRSQVERGREANVMARIKAQGVQSLENS